MWVVISWGWRRDCPTWVPSHSRFQGSNLDLERQDVGEHCVGISLRSN
ncbi:hypothetical protein IAD21_05604 [Abditibacteriota bacterium]|nr:hypothetical protein IAD21_05604 [Abditibacteriota bacterium]